MAGIPEATVTMRGEHTVVVGKQGGEVAINLENLEISCRQAPTGCQEAIDRMVANTKALTLGTPETTTPTRAQVRLTLKPAAWIAEANASIREQEPAHFVDNEVMTAPFAGDLVLSLAIDLPDGIMMANAKKLRDLGLDRDQAVALARQNLRAAYPSLSYQSLDGGKVFVVAGDDYAAALMALPELWAPLAGEVEGDLIVGAPVRNRLYAAGSEATADMAGLRRLVAGNQDGDHPVSALLFKWSPEGFTEFQR
jgi:hypothetical protein